jgi:hypothetical protein
VLRIEKRKGGERFFAADFAPQKLQTKIDLLNNEMHAAVSTHATHAASPFLGASKRRSSRTRGGCWRASNHRRVASSTVVVAVTTVGDGGDKEGQKNNNDVKRKTSGESSKAVGPSPSEVGGGSLFCFGLGYTSLGLVSTLKVGAVQVESS